MNLPALSFLSCTLLLALPTPGLPAQEAAKPAAPTITGTALVVKTADSELAEKIADMFASEGKLDELKAGECYVMTVDGDGKMAIAKEQGLPGFVQVRAKPAMLAEIFADKIDAAEQQIVMFAGMAAGQLGTTPQELTALIKDVFAFPKQVDALNLDVKGSPKEGFDGKVDMLPATAGWLAKFVSEMQTNKLGAPAIASADALFHMASNMDSATLVKAVQPFLGFMVGSATSDKEERKKYSAMMQQMLAGFDGTMSLAMAGDGSGHRLLCGLLDGSKIATLMGGEDYSAWRQANADANPNAEVELKSKALTHRDINCDKEVVSAGTPSGGERTTTVFSGVAGAFMFRAPAEAETKGMIDTILDQKVTRAPLPGNALLTVTAKIAEMARVMSDGAADTEDAPSKLDAALTKQGSGLNLSFKVGM